jgi:hypothetical protein
VEGEGKEEAIYDRVGLYSHTLFWEGENLHQIEFVDKLMRETLTQPPTSRAPFTSCVAGFPQSFAAALLPEKVNVQSRGV